MPCLWFTAVLWFGSIDSVKLASQGLRTASTSQAAVVAVLVGPFLRGDAQGEPDEQPVRQIHVPAFFIDQTEVTVAQYAECVKARVCKPPTLASWQEAGPNVPVTQVSWEDATTFCRFAQKRLPSETEWEKAARGTDGRRYPWGDEFACHFGNFGNYSMDGRCAAEGAPGKPVDVGSYPRGASVYGVLDMAGNVWEWTADTYRRDAYKRSEAGPLVGGPEEDLRVLRGGGCCSIFGLPRVADRWALPRNYRDGDIGFRCAKSGFVTPRGAGPKTPSATRDRLEKP